MNDIQDLFKDKDYCYQEIRSIRAQISKKDVQIKDFTAAIQSLAFMRLYCPEELLGMVDAQISEAETRERYILLKTIRESV